MALDSLIKYEFYNYQESLRFCRYIFEYGFICGNSGNITHEDILERHEKDNNSEILGFFALNKNSLFCQDFYVKNDIGTNPYRSLLIEILEAIKKNKYKDLEDKSSYTI